MPVTLQHIDAEIERRKIKAQIDAEIDRRSIPHWPTFRGAAAQLMAFVDTPDRPFEVMIAGPAETGKTLAALWFVDFFARTFPGAQITICRKLRSTMDGTVLNTWRRVIAIRGGVTPYGGEKPEWYDYHNGSRVWVAGLDNPGKALSSERDLIYVNQAEDLELDDWQTLSTRATGRGGVAPWSMLLGDCNSAQPSHWIVNRATLRRLESRHEDNPSLYHEDGTLTEQGVRTMRILDALEGVLKERLRFGRWVAAEGAVYAFDRRVHIITTMPEGWETWRKARVIDFGFENPFVCLWAAIDGDGRVYIYRQLYMSQRTVDQHAQTIKRAERWYKTEQHYLTEAILAATRGAAELAAFVDRYTLQTADKVTPPWLAAFVDAAHAAAALGPAAVAALARDYHPEINPAHPAWMIDRPTGRPVPDPRREKIEISIADHDAEGRATLLAEGVPTLPAKKDLLDGIQAVQKAMRKAGDARPRLFVLQDSLMERDEHLAARHHPTSIEGEFEVYVWPKDVDGRAKKEVPIKMYDHALDALRYLVYWLSRLQQIMR